MPPLREKVRGSGFSLMALLGFLNGQEVLRFLSELQIKLGVCVCKVCVSLHVFILASVNCEKLSKVGWGGWSIRLGSTGGKEMANKVEEGGSTRHTGQGSEEGDGALGATRNRKRARWRGGAGRGTNRQARW